jgi:hypothetical protein
VVSLKNNTQTALVTGFTTGLVNGTISNTISGPDGMIVIPSRNELWVGDGNGTVKVIDLFTSTLVASINTTSVRRADEFAYDPTNEIVVVTNPAEDTPFVSIISATNRTVLGKIMFPNVTELEQPTFNPTDGLFYVSVPSSGAHPGGSVCTLNIANMSIAKTIPLPDCVPAGIVFGPKNKLFVGCSEAQITTYGYAASYIIDVTTGNVTANISGLAGIDQVTYDSAANLFYASAYQNLANGSTPIPQLGVVNASSGTLVQILVTDNVTAHSVAVDINSGVMVVPIKSQGIVVYDLKSGVMGSGNSSGTSPGSTATTGVAPAATSSKVSAAQRTEVQGVVMIVLIGVAGFLIL